MEAFDTLCLHYTKLSHRVVFENSTLFKKHCNSRFESAMYAQYINTQHKRLQELT